MKPDIQIDPKRVRTMQIIVFALIAGVLMFSVVAIFVGLGKPAGEPFLGIIAAVFAVLMIVVRFTVPKSLSITQRSQLTAALNIEKNEDHPAIVDACINSYQLKVILESALLEGAAFFNVIAYLHAVQTWSLAIAGGLVAIMLMSFPTRGKIEPWVVGQLELMQMEVM